MKNPIRILFAGGGTGGHLYSGIAVAETLRAKYPDAAILFVGTQYGLEKDIVPAEGFDLQFLKVAPLKGSALKVRLKSLLAIPGAFRGARQILRQFKPAVVIGIGGYASGPLTLMARLMGFKTAIIEQNAYPGLTNRILGKFVHRVFLASARAASFFRSEKVRVTGNPVRVNFLSSSDHQPNPDQFTVFILGGSQGASSLNLAMMGALLKLQDVKDRLVIYHQTGKSDVQKVKEVYDKEGVTSEVFAFVSKIKSYYDRADLVICRAGAGTITELTLCAKPAILVPYPFAADDHQFYNAMDLVDANAAELIHNWDLTGEKLAERILYFMQNPGELARRGQAAHALAKPEAAASVLEESLDLLVQDRS